MLSEARLTAFLSDKDRVVSDVVNLVCICCIIGTLGIIANCINMTVFYMQGLKNTVNMGFFGLAISDTICLLSLIWGAICMNPLFVISGIKWFPMEVMYLTVAWPHVCFSRITACITVYITAERYLSIAIPLKVKDIITPKTTAVVLCLIYLINLATLVPEYATSYLGWRFFPSRNETLIGILFTGSRKSVEGIVFVLHFTLGIVSFVGVVLFTTLLVFKLGQSSDWRKKATSDHSKREAISARDKKTVKMIVLIACVLIVCYSPGAMISLGTFIAGPEFSIRGRYVNLCQAMWTTAYIFHSVNSSVNIFVYYSMSSKYRDTLREFLSLSSK